MDQNPTKDPRPPINLRIKFRSENVEQFIERYAVDVSRGGIFIRTREPLAVGTQLKLDFQFQNGSALMSGDGTVVWIREFDPNRTTVPPGMGVRFDKLSPDSQGVLEQLLVEKAKRERGGHPGSAGQGAGGIAVRRPSSMFSVLEPQVSVAEGTTEKATTTTANPTQPAAISPSLVEKLAAKPLSAKAESKTDSPYRPLGTAKNPFSGTPGPTLTPPPADPSSSSPSSGGGPRPLSDLLPLFAGGGKAVPASAPTPKEAVHTDFGASFDDLNEEPTQIAGRLPSFLTSDDDATTEVPADLAASVRTAAPLPADFLPGASPDSQRPGATRAKQSLDEAPPKTAAAAPAAVADAGKAEATAASAAPSSASTTPARTEPAPRAPTPVTTATAIRADAPAAKKRSGAVVAAAVVILGASAVFLYKFFGSNATENVVTAPSSASVPAVATGAPATPPAPAPAAEPAAPAAPPAAAAPSAAEPAPPAAEAKPAAPVAAPSEETVGATPKRSSKKKAKAATTVAAAEPAAAPAAPAAAPAGPTGTAAAAPTEGTDTAAVSHQIKVTSKPVGADVSLDGQVVGQTPFSMGIADISAPHSIAIRKDGFEPLEQMIGPSSAWSKTKSSKGKPALSILKLNAKLKPIGGAAASEGKGTIEPPATNEGAAKAEAPKVERPLPPTDQPAEGQ